MRKPISGLLAVVIAVSFAGCGNGAGSSAKAFGNSYGNHKAGDYVEFGNYNWQVLEVKGSKGLIISERVLDYLPYNNKAEDTTWAECDLREYLNNDFLSSFSDDERKLIMSVKNENPDNPWDFREQGGINMTDGGADTEDRVFILDIDDVIKYYSKDGKDSMIYESQLGAREEKFSDGNEEQRRAYFLNGSISNPQAVSWILRTPGMYQDTITYIGISGAIDMDGIWVEDERCGIRPAMWIKNINSLKKSVMKCTDPECSMCKSGIYGETFVPDTACPFCGYRGECTSKKEHNRLYHDWRYNYVTITDDMIDEMYLIEDEFKNEWLKIAELLEEGESFVNSNNGGIRIAAVVSNDVRSKVLAVEVKEISLRRNYKAMTAKQFNEEKAYLENRTELLREVEDTLNQAIIEANSSAKTAGENGRDLVNAVLIEVVREKSKEFMSDINEKLWKSGYYYKLAGVVHAEHLYDATEEKVQDQIDEFFGSNKLEDWGEKKATLDEYLKAIFLNDDQ